MTTGRMPLKQALKIIGEIVPEYDKETDSWSFESPHFPKLEIHENTAEEVVKNYPKFLKEHLDDLHKGNLADSIIEATPGWGGKRPGSGRKKNSEPTKTVRLPSSMADWVKANQDKVIDLMEA